jgi:tetratricopeptide (TPR) repeat protein
VLTWNGEVLLWLGEYRRALRAFDAAVRMGAVTFVYGWRGAARLKLGDPHGALRDLDRALALDPKDLEAVVWRGETLRLLGRYDEACRDLDHFIAHHPSSAWGYLNRGLLLGARGDEAGMRDDFARLPSGIASLLRRRFRIPDGRNPDPAQLRRMMQAGLDLARGVRRWEAYVDRIWMRRVRASRVARRPTTGFGRSD